MASKKGTEGPHSFFGESADCHVSIGSYDITVALHERGYRSDYRACCVVYFHQNPVHYGIWCACVGSEHGRSCFC